MSIRQPIKFASLYFCFRMQVQVAMDVFLAKLNSVCIYTVPKHIKYSKVSRLYLLKLIVNRVRKDLLNTLVSCTIF